VLISAISAGTLIAAGYTNCPLQPEHQFATHNIIIHDLHA